MRINLLARVATIALFSLMSVAAASAQIQQASGKVMLTQADGTTVPVKDAVVVFYRTDIKGEYKTKTDKSGKYVYAALPYTGTYTIVVSAPNAQPTFSAGVRISRKPENDFTLQPGDGSALTLEQISTALKAAPGGAAAPPADAAAARRAKEEYDKQVAAINAENEKAKATNAQLNEFLKAGNTAFNSKNYDQAVASYDQGIQADPTQAVFYSNKSAALRARATDKYNASIKAKDTAGIAAARTDFKTATEAADKAITLYRANKSKNGAAGGAAAAAATQPQNEELTTYLAPRAETYRVALQAKTPNIAEPGVKAIQEYLAVETDLAKKAKVQVSLGDALMQSGLFDESIVAYKTVLTASPDNLDAMYGIGVALAALAGEPPNPAKLVEARDMLQRFANKAPASDPRKQEAESIAQSFDALLKTKPAANPTKGRRKS
ncbi:MAG: carboxypeptidase regulatory-like domain-containing protein [Pyrinomonadaceae bacterium]